MAKRTPSSTTRPNDVMDWRVVIRRDPKRILGKTVVGRTNLTPEQVLESLAGGCTYEQVLAKHPGLTPGDVHACMAFAADKIKQGRHMFWAWVAMAALWVLMQ